MKVRVVYALMNKGQQRKKQSQYQGRSDKALYTMSMGLVSGHTMTCGVGEHDWDGGIDEARGLLHVHFFMKGSMEKSI
ncbi:unnamed protein product [Prunus armeniaca]